MTIRKSKPERRRERDRDVNSRHHRHRSGHNYRNSVDYIRQGDFRAFNQRSSRRNNTSSSSSSSKSGSSISDQYSFNETYGWQRGAAQTVESDEDVNPELSLWHDVSDPEAYSDKNNSDDEYRKSHQYCNSERDFEFARRLREEKGYEICCMAEDGACLFRAVAHHIFGDSAMHEEVRRLTIDYISLNRDYFSQFITEDFDHYIARKRKNDCYGNHVELQAISEMYNRPLEIYRYSTEPQRLTPQIDPANLEMASPIRLSYHNEGHYNAVIDPYKATVGVGLGLPGYQPGSADRLQIDVAKKESELLELEEAMLKDKLKETNYEAVQEQIEKQVAAESFLEWFNKKGGSSVSDNKDSGSSRPSPSRSPELRYKSKSPSTSSATPPLKYKERCPGRSSSQAGSPGQSKPAKNHGATPSSSGSGKRRTPRTSPPTGACSPSVYGATAAASSVLASSPKSMSSSTEAWSGGAHNVHFDETASLMNESIPVELKDWDDFILHQVLVESQREYLLQFARKRDNYQSGDEQSSSVCDEHRGKAGCSKD